MGDTSTDAIINATTTAPLAADNSDGAVSNTTTTDAHADWLSSSSSWSSVYANQIIILKVGSLLSAIGSAWIVYSMVAGAKDAADRKKKLDRTFDRLLLCLCAADLVSSMSFFLGSWSVPANPPSEYPVHTYYAEPWDVMFPQASGNMATCTAQGFFVSVAGGMTGWLTGCIAVSFLLQVKYKFRETSMRIVERCSFGVSTVLPLLFGIIVLADRGYNPNANGFCWIEIFPRMCGTGRPKKAALDYYGTPESIQDYCANDVDVRGRKSKLYQFTFFIAPGVLVLLTIIACMTMLFWSVRTQELRAARWSEAAAGGRDQKRVFMKSMLYIGAFLVVWGPPVISIAIDFWGEGEQYVIVIFAPIQGILNVLIYSDLIKRIKEGTASIARSIMRSTARNRNSSSATVEGT